jgi:hypothetical protein
VTGTAAENDESRWTAPILWREPARGKGENSAVIRGRARNAVFRIAARAVIHSHSASPARKFEPTLVQAWHQHSSRNENQAPTIGAPERPSGPAEIIMLLLANGLSWKQIRAMYPGLFSHLPEPGS